MCRIAALVNIPALLGRTIHRLQANGATRRPEIYAEQWRDGVETRTIELIHSRFDVTSSTLSTGAFPYRDPKYVFHHNGEIFAFKDQPYVGSRAVSDAHFASKHLSNHTVKAWLESLDFQGTIQLYDKVRRILYVAVDQLNTQGGFYAAWNKKVVVAEEVAIIETVLCKLKAPKEVPIHKIKGGRYLEVSENGEVKIHVYRRSADDVFSASGHHFNEVNSLTVDSFRTHSEAFANAFIESVERRLPEVGPVAVLCSGGIDSAYLLQVVCTLLKTREEMGRLVVFTLGKDGLPVEDEENDWHNADRLFNNLDGIFDLKASGAKHIQISPDSKMVAELYRSKVFCSEVSRLITPDPVLNTQVRHTVRMSIVLAEIAWMYPDLKVVLSGDGADELFAGYNSMWEQCRSVDELRSHVVEKLHDLCINDCARVALAAFHGTCAALKAERIRPLLSQRRSKEAKWLLRNLDTLSAEDMLTYMDRHSVADKALRSALKALHPIEVRMPFTSHVVLESLKTAHPACLIGEINGRMISKFLLRYVALEAGLPLALGRRKKIPFHEGGTGVRNSQRFVEEENAAKSYAKADIADLRRLNLEELRRLALYSPGNPTGATDEQVVCLDRALHSGLARLLQTDAFRKQMPDCIYTTTDAAVRFIPGVYISFDVKTGALVLKGKEQISGNCNAINRAAV